MAHAPAQHKYENHSAAMLLWNKSSIMLGMSKTNAAARSIGSCLGKRHLGYIPNAITFENGLQIGYVAAYPAEITAGCFDSDMYEVNNTMIKVTFILEDCQYQVEAYGESRLQGILNRFLVRTGRIGNFEVRTADTGIKVDTRQRLERDATFALVKVS